MNYSLEGFWKVRLAAVQNAATCTRPGWSTLSLRDDSFVEASLSLRKDFDDLSCPVWLVAAPGAVGKSMFARELCAATGAVYVDLAQAEAVGGSYVVGGLVNNNLLDQWKAGRATLVIDALDEARLRVTQAAFEDFLQDVASVARSGALPLVLIGRVGIVEECWAQLNDRAGFNCPIFDIEFFSPDRAVDFVMASLAKLARTTHSEVRSALATHQSEYRRAVDDVVKRLVEASSKDGNRFAGYAPVLEAVAKVIAGETNPAQVGPRTLKVLEGRVLDRLTTEILQRESRKLVGQLKEAVNNFPDNGAYEEAEQLSRLASRIFGVPFVGSSATLPPHCLAPYERAVAVFIEQHPFLDGAGRAPSGAVFAACIVSHALQSATPELARAAEGYAREGHHAPNPFLFDFYRAALKEDAIVPGGHVGALYESVQAKARPGDTTRLSIEGDTDAEFVEVEIAVAGETGDPLRFELRTRGNETVRFGRRVGGIAIDAPGLDVELGDGGQLELIAPVTIEVRTLMLRCSELLAKPAPHAPSHGGASKAESEADEAAVVLESQDFLSENNAPLLTVRPGIELRVTWPGSKAYPWNPFSDPGAVAEDPTTADALRSLRRLVIAFRSHSKGRLARYRGKIEHARMTKGGIGDSLRLRLVKDNVMSLEGSMYFLDPKVLGAKVGLSFLDAKLKRYGPLTRAYVQGLA